MAKTKQKRKRKHRGTPAGTVERAAHNSPRGRAQSTSQPRTKEEQRADRAARREERMLKPPTWQGTFTRAGIAALVLFALALLALDRSPAQAATLAIFSLVLYVPLGYMLDRAMYRRAVRRKERREGGAGKGGEGRPPKDRGRARAGG